MSSRIFARVVAAAALAAAAYAGVPAAPASAAGCPTAHGVTVVVDFHELGGGVQTGCVADGGGRTASELFPDAGFPLTYVQRQPGFVCRVSGKPADNPCVSTPPADAYWALYVSDGESGRWSYATSSAGGQHVPDGGYVAFSWQGSDQSTPPGYRPAPHPSASPTPTTTHTSSPSHAGSSAPQSAHPSSQQPSQQQQTGQPSSATRTASKSAGASASASAKRGSKGPKPSAAATPTATTSESESPSESPSVTPASSDPADPGDGGLPGWVAPVVIVVLFGGAGAVAVVRRRQGSA